MKEHDVDYSISNDWLILLLYPPFHTLPGSQCKSAFSENNDKKPEYLAIFHDHIFPVGHINHSKCIFMTAIQGTNAGCPLATTHFDLMNYLIIKSHNTI